LIKRFAVLSSYKYTLWFTASCFFLSTVLILMSRKAEGFAQWYAATIYPVFPNTVGRMFSAWNVSIFEAGILAGFLLLILLLTGGIVLTLIRSPLRRIYHSRLTRGFLCLLAGLTLIYTLTCAINYQRDGIGAVLNLPVQTASKDSLKKLNYILAEEMVRLTGDPDWDYRILSSWNPADIEAEAVSAMKKLGKTEPSLSGYYPKPKPVHHSEVLSAFGIEGIFSPFTMEANYNKAMTSFLIPFTISHELAHLKGYMKEEDAGFIAYLACRESSSKVFQYSGLFHALIYSLNALKAEATAEEFNEIYGKLPEPVRLQLRYIKEQSTIQTAKWKAATHQVNNLYLAANAQPGMKSYGLMVDLLIAEYADRMEAENMNILLE